MGGWLLAFLLLLAGFVLPHSVQAEEAAKTDTETKYVNFTVESSEDMAYWANNDISKYSYQRPAIELSGGTIVRKEGVYYLQIDFAKDSSTSNSTYLTSFGYIKDNEKVDLLENAVFKESQSFQKDSSTREIYTAEIPLEISSFEDAKDRKIQLYAVNNKSEEIKNIIIILQEPQDQFNATTSVELKDPESDFVDGKVLAHDGNNRKFSVRAFNNYSTAVGEIVYYYTVDGSEVTESSTAFQKISTIKDAFSTTEITIPDDNPDEYTVTVRVRGKVLDTNEWLDEQTLEVKLGKASYQNYVYDKDKQVQVSAGDGYNTFPLDTEMTVKKVSDEEELGSYGKTLKELMGESYGKYYAISLKLTGANGGEVEILRNANSTPANDGLWGDGYYQLDLSDWGFGKTFDLKDGDKSQDTYLKYLLFALDKEEGYLPSNTDVFYVKEDGDLQQLPKQTEDYIDDKNSTDVVTSWDWNGNPSGTYIIMQEPWTDTTKTLTKNRTYFVNARLVEAETDDDGNVQEQWFSNASEFNSNLKNKVRVAVDADGNKAVYLTLKGDNGIYLSNVKYRGSDGSTCEKVETQTVDGTAYPKTVKITLSDADKNKAYIPLTVKVGKASYDVNLALAWGTASKTDAFTLTKPVITTTTGTANFVNDATAEVTISADAYNGVIYYTTDGTEPTTTSAKYEGKISLKADNKEGQSYTIKAFVAKEGYENSAVTTYTVNFKKEGELAEVTEKPLINATYAYSKEDNGDTAETGYYTLSLTSETEGAEFYYTLDGTEPTRESTKYQGDDIIPAMTDGKATQIRAIAVKDGYNDSEESAKEIKFSTDWWDNLEEGKEYTVGDQLYNITKYIYDDTKELSAGASALTGTATLFVKDGKPYLKVPIQSVTVGIKGYLTRIWYYDGNDNNDGKTYAVKFSNSSQEGAIEVTEENKTRDEEGHVDSVTLPLYGSDEKVFIGLETDVDIMGKKGAIIWLDYSDVIEKVTGKKVEKKESSQTPVITTTYDDNKENCTIKIEAAEGADIYYTVHTDDGEHDWKKYTGEFTVKATDSTVENAITNIYAKAEETGKDTSDVTVAKLQFASSGSKDTDTTDTIKDGTYSVPVSMLQTYSDEESMGNAVLDHNAIVTVSGGKATIDVSFDALDRKLGSQQLHGHVTTLSSYESDTKSALTEAAVIKTVEDVGLDSVTKGTFPYTFRISGRTAGEDTIFVNVVVDAVSGFPQDARLVFNWSKAVKYNTSTEKKDNNSNNKTTAKTVGKKGAKFVVAGNTYKLTSVGKNPTASLVKASKKKSRLVIPATVKKNGFKVKVTAIANNACRNNKKIRTVVIGKNVKTIGSRAFMNCKNVKKITVKSKKITKVKKNAFKNINKKAVIKVPKKKYKKYKKLFKNKGQRKTVKITK